MDLELIVRKGGQPGRVFLVSEGELKTAGRSPACDIRLPEQGVSRRHCTIRHKGRKLEIVDLDSANGTFVNGRRIKRGRLGVSDKLAIGPTVLECRAAPAEHQRHAATMLALSEGGTHTLLRKVVDTEFRDGAALPEDLENLQRAQRNFATAYQVSKMLAGAGDLEGLFEGVIDAILSALNADRAALLLRDPGGHEGDVRVVSARSRAREQPLEAISVSRTVVRDVLDHGVSSLSRDATADDRYRAGESIIEQGIRSVMCAPVASDERILGVLYADSRRLTGAFSESDLELLALIGNQAGVAIHRARLIAQLEKFFYDTIRAIVATLDAKDGYTHRHSERVAAFATRLALELGLGREELEAVKLAALLHDVGKIGLPEAILTKRGPLTEAEFAEVRKHPIHGVDILRHIKSPRFQAILPAVRHHHERWDGSGYPDGLVGAKIPFLGRLLAVADVLDALSSDRHYRDRLGFEEAVGVIRRHAGRHFDPDIAEAALALHQRGELEVPARWLEPDPGADLSDTLDG